MIPSAATRTAESVITLTQPAAADKRDYEGMRVHIFVHQYAPLIRWGVRTPKWEHKSGARNYRRIRQEASRLIHLQGAFAKTKHATNILRPAIDVSFIFFALI